MADKQDDKKEVTMSDLVELWIYIILIIFAVIMLSGRFDDYIIKEYTDTAPFILSCCPPIIIIGTLAIGIARYNKWLARYNKK